MRPWIKAGIMSATLLSGAGAALGEETPLVLVELFTSQGCSSCPPADALLRELAGRDDVMALALHVDYWDYIGWADSFARPEHTDRQKAYAHVAGASTIYTPQMVIGGLDHVVGYKPMSVADHMQAHRDGLGAVMVETEVVDGLLRIKCIILDGTKVTGDILVDLVSFRPEEVVEIRHGENAGETITYSNIVTGWERLAEWDGNEPLELDTARPGTDELALVLQEPGPGRVLAAFRID